MYKIIIGLIVLAGVSYFAYAYKADSPKTDEKMMAGEEVAMEKEEGAMMEKDGDSMMKAGSYMPYSGEKLAMANTGDVVLFFRASWCPTCRAADANIRANSGKIPENLTILDVDYDNSADLKKKYGVTYQHTFVQVDASGNQIKKWSGSPTLEALVSQVQ